MSETCLMPRPGGKENHGQPKTKIRDGKLRNVNSGGNTLSETAGMRRSAKGHFPEQGTGDSGTGQKNRFRDTAFDLAEAGDSVLW